MWRTPPVSGAAGHSHRVWRLSGAGRPALHGRGLSGARRGGRCQSCDGDSPPVPPHHRGPDRDGPRNVGTGHEVPNPAWLTGPTVSFIASFETVVPLDPVTVKTILGDRRRSVKGDRTGVQAIARVLDRAGVVRDWCAGMPDNQRLLPNARRWTLIERQFVRHSSLLPAELPVPLCAVRAQV